MCLEGVGLNRRFHGVEQEAVCICEEGNAEVLEFGEYFLGWEAGEC